MKMNSNLSICRVCLLSDAESILYSLQDTPESNTEYTFMEMFNACSHLEALEFDDLPQLICQSCSNDLQLAFDFLIKAATSDQFLKSQKVEDEKYGVLDEDTDEKQAESFHFIEMTVEDEEDLFDQHEETKPMIETDSNKEEGCFWKQGFDKEFERFTVADNASETHHSGTNENSLSESAADVKANDSSDETEVNEIESIPNSKSKNAPKKISPKVACGDCGKLISRKSLSCHLKRCRKEEKLFLCSSCPKSFPVASDLRNHMKKHDAERPRNHICPECGKGFYAKQPLLNHIMQHTGNKEFQCKLCLKNFATKRHLINHEFIHNRELGKITCKYCDKKFFSKSDFKVHERFHTGDYPYQCEYCNKSYAVKSHLNYHIAKHKGVMYKCNLCEKEFINRGSLKFHKYRHDERMPYECSVCKKGFPSNYKLNRHTSIHKNIEDKGPEPEENTIN